MDRELKDTEMNKMLFMHVAMMFGAAAMQQMGKLVNPATGKSEADLPGAQTSIDVLTMLAEKTKGNLDKDEERFLRETLSSLQMNFVETAAAAEKSAAEQKSGEKEKPADKAAEKKADAPAASEEPAPEAPAGPDSGDKSSKTPKFHKSYGEE